MTLKSDIKVIDFLKSVNECKQDVWFRTNAGDCINLKSELSKYLFLTAVSTPGKTFYDLGEISCEDPSDYSTLADYLTAR